MVNQVIQWPAGFPWRHVTLHLQPVQTTGPRALSGRAQTRDTGESLWRLTLVTAPLQEARLREFGALIARQRGLANIAEIPLRLPYGYTREVAPRQVAHGDGEWLGGGMGYTDGGEVQPLVVTAGCAAGAQAITVGLSAPVRPAPRVGDHFSDGGFLYRITGVAGGVLTFEPRARAAILVGATLGTEFLVTRWRLAGPDEGRAQVDYGRRTGEVTLQLVEAFER